jgi:hypothetical protein
MPRSHVQGLAEESDMPELPRILGREAVEQDRVTAALPGKSETSRGSSSAFSREDFEDMRQRLDLAPSLTGEDDDSFIPLGRPGHNYITIHPDPDAYDWQCPVVYDFRKSNNRDEPYLVMPTVWAKFHGLLRVKRLLLCMRFVDDAPRPFIWVADWHERSEAATELHNSIARVIVKGRQGWGQTPFIGNLYTWRKWAKGMGPEPEPLWPDRDFYSILQETFQNRIIATPDHELVLCRGEEER